MYESSGPTQRVSRSDDGASATPPQPLWSLRHAFAAAPAGLALARQRMHETTPPAWLTRMLDEVDYGMLLVNVEARVLYLNHAARLELDDQHPLQLIDLQLHAQRAQDVAPLYDALAAAQQGLRRLVHVGAGEQQVTVSVVPQSLGPVGGVFGRADFGLDAAWPASNELCSTRRGASMGAAPTLLVLGKRQVCAPLTVQAYASSVALTPTETRVLQMLCEGHEPNDVAREHNVAVSTVRSQIGAIRTKTGTNSIRDLVRRVALLPPLVGALRGGLAR